MTQAKSNPSAPSTSTVAEDKVFAEPRKLIDDFAFGANVAAVFDDMLNRSVPFYSAVQQQVGELVGDFAAGGTNVYDLGCSTANTFLAVAGSVSPETDVRFVGIDSSPEMLDKARAKLTAAHFPWQYDLIQGDLNQGVHIENASVVLLILTLQFIRPLHRDNLLSSIYRGMTKNSCLILVEKLLGENSTFNRLFIKHYYELKRKQGYSELEISQKREALENVLIPYRLEENKQMLKRAGFEDVDVFFKWYNFGGIIAMKTA